MADNALIKILTALLKHQVKRTLGEETLGVLGQELACPNGDFVLKYGYPCHQRDIGIMKNRSLLIVSILLSILSLVGSFVVNIASNNLPDSWGPYVWLAYPITGVIVVLTIALVYWQWNIAVKQDNQSNPIKSKDFQKADSIFNAPGGTINVVQQVTIPMKPAHENPTIDQTVTPIALKRAIVPSSIEPKNKDDFKYDVFISYSHKDEEWVVNTLLPSLEKVGLKTCIDFRDFDVGKPSILNIENAVDESRHTVLVLTPNWVGSEWTDFEAILTQTDDPAGRRQKLIPIMLINCVLPKRISMLTWVDFKRKDRESIAWAQLFAAITS